nr:retrovirus-related Pol polyprotein from transposon TNT 1-94 [Tanacetum cinerariifolium]
DKKLDEGYIVGYSISSKAYRVYNLVSKKIEETMNLKFLENKPFVAGTGQAWITPPISAGSTPQLSPCASPISADRHSSAAGKSYVSAGRPTGSVGRPVSADPDWVEAMQAEMQQFRNQKVWVLITLPDGKRAIGTKLILKNKRDARGIVCRNKARIYSVSNGREECFPLWKDC